MRILKMLEQRPLCVCEIQYVLKGSQPNVSHHLKTLYDAGLVESKKDGLWVDYRLPDNRITSYNVCYTKLLRVHCRDHSNIIDNGWRKTEYAVYGKCFTGNQVA